MKLQKPTLEKTVLILGCVFLVASLVVIGASAVLTIFSNPVVIQVNGQPTVNLVANATTAIVGDSVRLSATLSDTASNIPITFYLNETAIGTVNTDLMGNAVYLDALEIPGRHAYVARAVYP